MTRLRGRWGRKKRNADKLEKRNEVSSEGDELDTTSTKFKIKNEGERKTKTKQVIKFKNSVLCNEDEKKMDNMTDNE